MTRFRRIVSLLSTASILLACPLTQAQDYPAKPIRIIAPFPAGSGPDVDTRSVAAELSKVLGQTIAIENRPGASGAIGLDAGAKASPDGYTLVVGTTTTLGALPHLSAKLPFDIDRDLAAVSMMGYLNVALLANAAIPPGNVRDLIAQAKRQPESLNVATFGVGGGQHLAGEQFGLSAGIKFNFIPYNTSTPFADLVGGQVQLLFDALPASIGNVRAGKLKILAITGTNRHPAFPEIPTFAESGLAGYNPTFFIGLMAPAGTPSPILEKLSAAMKKAVTQNQALIEKWRGNGGELKATTPDEFKTFIKAESAKWADVIRKTNVRIE